MLLGTNQPADGNPAIVIMSTCPDEPSAQTIAAALIEDKLAACVNIIAGVTSVYQWQGKIEQSHEQCLIIKTLKHNYAAVERSIQELHPYELPEVISVPISEGSEQYLSWIAQNVNPMKKEV